MEGVAWIDHRWRWSSSTAPDWLEGVVLTNHGRKGGGHECKEGKKKERKWGIVGEQGRKSGGRVWKKKKKRESLMPVTPLKV